MTELKSPSAKSTPVRLHLPFSTFSDLRQCVVEEKKNSFMLCKQVRGISTFYGIKKANSQTGDWIVCQATKYHSFHWLLEDKRGKKNTTTTKRAALKNVFCLKEFEFVTNDKLDHYVFHGFLLGQKTLQDWTGTGGLPPSSKTLS